MISDTISGIDINNGYLQQNVPVVIRYAKSVQLRVQLDPNSSGKIRRPLLQIEYEERFTSQISDKSVAEIQYFVDYYQDSDSVNSAFIGIMIAANVLIAIIIAVRVFYHLQHNPPAVLGTKFTRNIVTHTIFFIMNEWSTIMFWVSFFSCGYWFINYKLSESAVLLLPSTEEENSFYDKFSVVFYMMLVFKTLSVLF